jgi:hypothetical protein
VFSAFYNKQFGNYWYQSGSPKFLIDLVDDNWRLDQVYATNNYLSHDINAIDIGELSPQALLFQSGYLTVDKVDKSMKEWKYYLRFPNEEVEASLYKLVLRLKDTVKWLPLFLTHAKAMLASFTNLDAEGLEASFSSLLASIPQNLHTPNVK